VLGCTVKLNFQACRTIPESISLIAIVTRQHWVNSLITDHYRVLTILLLIWLLNISTLLQRSDCAMLKLFWAVFKTPIVKGENGRNSVSAAAKVVGSMTRQLTGK
jgi:hypothetical protein